MSSTELAQRRRWVQDFERQADLVSVDHPGVVEHYRQAHGIYVTSQSRPVTTEDMRGAFIAYRSLFSELVDEGREAWAGPPGPPPVPTLSSPSRVVCWPALITVRGPAARY